MKYRTREGCTVEVLRQGRVEVITLSCVDHEEPLSLVNETDKGKVDARAEHTTKDVRWY